MQSANNQGNFRISKMTSCYLQNRSCRCKILNRPPIWTFSYSHTEQLLATNIWRTAHRWQHGTAQHSHHINKKTQNDDFSSRLPTRSTSDFSFSRWRVSRCLPSTRGISPWRWKQERPSKRRRNYTTLHGGNWKILINHSLWTDTNYRAYRITTHKRMLRPCREEVMTSMIYANSQRESTFLKHEYSTGVHGIYRVGAAVRRAWWAFKRKSIRRHPRVLNVSGENFVTRGPWGHAQRGRNLKEDGLRHPTDGTLHHQTIYQTVTNFSSISALVCWYFIFLLIRDLKSNPNYLRSLALGMDPLFHSLSSAPTGDVLFRLVPYRFYFPSLLPMFPNFVEKSEMSRRFKIPGVPPHPVKQKIWYCATHVRIVTKKYIYITSNATKIRIYSNIRSSRTTCYLTKFEKREICLNKI